MIWVTKAENSRQRHGQAPDGTHQRAELMYTLATYVVNVYIVIIRALLPEYIAIIAALLFQEAHRCAKYRKAEALPSR
jgi:hypothetical protein